MCGCVEGAFHPDLKTGETCQSCPVGGNCRGSTFLPYPNVEFWGNASNPVEFYECETSKCLGGQNFSCSEGNCCNMCEGTLPGYFSLGSGLRFKCPATELGRWLLSLAIIVLVLCAFILIHNYLCANFDSMDIFLDSIQRLAITSKFRLRWHKGFTTASIFTFFEIVLLDADIAKPECLLPGGWTFEHSFWLQFALLLFFLAEIWLPCMWQCVRAKLKDEQTWMQVCWTGSSASVDRVCKSIRRSVDILSMMYAGIAKLVFDTYTCRRLGSVTVLVADPNFACGTPEHTSIQVSAGFTVGLGSGLEVV